MDNIHITFDCDSHARIFIQVLLSHAFRPDPSSALVEEGARVSLSMSSARAVACAVVTGSNTGIGLEIARGLSRTLPTVVTSRSLEKGKTAVEILKKSEPELDLHLIQLDIDDGTSVEAFCKTVDEKFPGGVSILVNNAAIAFKARDPTPFEGQTEPTLRTNVYSTLRFTEAILPRMKRASSGRRIVFLASQAGTHALSGCSSDLQKRWTDPSLGIDGITSLLQEFQDGVSSGQYREKGWPSSNYGVSKLAVIAAARAYSKRLAEDGIIVASVCPGYCKTNMSSHRGNRDAAKGAETPIWLATASGNSITSGGFYHDQQQLM